MSHVANRLTLNLKKTHYVIFSLAKNNKHIYDDLIINNKVIDRVVSTKFLGVIIDAQLKFREHIAQIKGKIGILEYSIEVRNSLTSKPLLTFITHSYILIYLTVWSSGETPTQHILTL